MARFFAAIELDEAARECVAREQLRLAGRIGGESLRWVRPEHLHVTLVFAGEIAADRVGAIEQTMNEDVNQAPFRLELAGRGIFPAHGPPRALWIGVRGGEHQVVAVQREIAQRLEDHGVPVERRPFHPHLTLARWRARSRGPRPDRLGGSDDAIAGFAVTRVVLIESRLSSAGPSYSVRAFARLAGPGAGLH
jgi:2'-5' RNA ligase